MGILRKVIAVITGCALAVSLVGLGFIVCLAPPTTHALATVFADDITSPFKKSQLVQVADATRDFSFAAHDEQALYQVIYEVDLQYANELERMGGQLPADFPALALVADDKDLSQLKAAFQNASEMYCFSPETVEHLDDCNTIARVAYPILIVFAILALVGFVITGFIGRARTIGRVLLGAGIALLLIFAALGIWAVIDFTGFFAAFHQVFFSQGNWVFPYDSLLICALPTAFWMGMGIIWLSVTLIASILSVILGVRLLRSKR